MSKQERDFYLIVRSDALDPTHGGAYVPLGHIANPTDDGLQLGLLHEIRDACERHGSWYGRTDIAALTIGKKTSWIHATREGLTSDDGGHKKLTPSERKQCEEERQRLIAAAEREPLMCVFLGEQPTVLRRRAPEPVGQLKVVLRSDYGERLQDEAGHLFVQYKSSYGPRTPEHLHRSICPACKTTADKLREREAKLVRELAEVEQDLAVALLEEGCLHQLQPALLHSRGRRTRWQEDLSRLPHAPRGRSCPRQPLPGEEAVMPSTEINGRRCVGCGAPGGKLRKIHPFTGKREEQYWHDACFNAVLWMGQSSTQRKEGNDAS